MKKKFVSIIALCMLAILLTVAPVSAGAIVTKEERTVIEVDEDINYDDVCPDIETIHVEGKYIRKTTTVLDGNGWVHFSTHWNWANFTGTGLTSGDTYVVTQTFSRMERNFWDSTEFDGVTMIFSSNLVSKGSGANIILQGVNRYTMNANGEVTVDKTTFSFVCK